jgi:hypothetical protein
MGQWFSGVVERNEAFKEMETEARFIKKHFLLLPLPDYTHTPVPPPTGQPALTITYPGGHHVLMVLKSILTLLLKSNIVEYRGL